MAITRKGLKNAFWLAAGGGIGAAAAVAGAPVVAPLTVLSAGALGALSGLGLLASKSMMERHHRESDPSIFLAGASGMSFSGAVFMGMMSLLVGATSFDTSLKSKLRDEVTMHAGGNDWRGVTTEDLAVRGDLRLDLVTKVPMEAQARNVTHKPMVEDGVLKVRSCIDFDVAVKGEHKSAATVCSDNPVPQEDVQRLLKAPAP